MAVIISYDFFVISCSADPKILFRMGPLILWGNLVIIAHQDFRHHFHDMSHTTPVLPDQVTGGLPHLPPQAGIG